MSAIVASPLYGELTALTATLGGMASGAARESAYISCGEFLDLQLRVIVRTAVSPAPTGSVDVYAYLNQADDSEFPYPVTGADAAITMPTAPHNLKLIGSVFPKSSAAITPHTFPSIASALGGNLAGARIGFVFHNNTNKTLHALSNIAAYRGYRLQAA